MLRLATTTALGSALGACSLLLDTSDFTSSGAPSPEAGAEDVTAESASGTDAPDVVSGYAAEVLADQPIAYWRMGKVNGGVVLDETANANHLAFANGAMVAGVEGAVTADTAIRLEGTTGGSATDSRALDFPGTNAFTIELWVKRAASGGGTEYQHLFSHYDGDAPNRRGYLLYFTKSAGEFSFERDTVVEQELIVAPGAVVDTWEHIATVFDGTNILLYRNGANVSSTQSGGALQMRGSTFIVGAKQGGSSAFAGSIDEMAVYPKALTAADVLRHYLAR